jgi:hypothetical protein
MDSVPIRRLALGAAACGALSSFAAVAGMAVFGTLGDKKGVDATALWMAFGPMVLMTAAFFTAVGFVDSLFTLADVDLARAWPLIAAVSAAAAFFSAPLLLFAGPIALCAGLAAMRLSRLLFRLPPAPGSDDGRWHLHTLPRSTSASSGSPPPR